MNWTEIAKKLIAKGCDLLGISNYGWVYLNKNGAAISFYHPDVGFQSKHAPLLEYAIREDIERRGWYWEVGHQWHFQIHDGITAEGYLARIPMDATTEYEATASTPLEALALAYQEALEDA